MKHAVYIFLAYFMALPMVVMAKSPINNDPYISELFDVSGDAQIDMTTAGASIQVESWEYDQVQVDVFVTRNGKPVDPFQSDIAALLEDIDFNIGQNGDLIFVEMKTRSRIGWSSGRNNLNFRFELFVPERTSAKLKSAGGSISLVGLDGNHSLASSGGSIQVIDCAGGFDAKSSGGSFSVSSFVGNLDIASSGGSIKVSDLVGSLKVSSSGGSLTLEDIAGSLTANTSGGSIRANLVSLEGEVNLKTSGGGITAVLPKGEGMDLNLTGTSSRIKLENFEGEISSNTVRGKLNGGGIPVAMASAGGSVKLEFK